MGGHHRDRSRSRSPRRHKDDDGRRDSDRRDRDRDREHKDRRDRDRDRDRRDERESRRSDGRDETDEERRERKRQKREKEREREDRHRRKEKRREGVKVVDDDEAGDLWIEKDVDTSVRSLSRDGLTDRVRWARSRRPTHSLSSRVPSHTGSGRPRPSRLRLRASRGCSARTTRSLRPLSRGTSRSSLPEAISSPPSGRSTSARIPTRRRSRRPR